MSDFSFAASLIHRGIYEISLRSQAAGVVPHFPLTIDGLLIISDDTPDEIKEASPVITHSGHALDGTTVIALASGESLFVTYWRQAGTNTLSSFGSAVYDKVLTEEELAEEVSKLRAENESTSASLN